VRYSSWTCEGDLNPYETDIPSGTKCTTSCPAWRGLGDEPLVLESTCVEGNQWTSTRPSQPFGVRALPYVTPIYNTPDMEDMVCGCQDVGPFDYNPNNEDLAELVCTGGEPKDFDAPGGWNFTTTDRCDLFCNQEPVVSVYCEGSTWVGEPEKGIWCYTRPENPGPREDFDEEGGSGVEESGDEGSEEDRLGAPAVDADGDGFPDAVDADGDGFPDAATPAASTELSGLIVAGGAPDQMWRNIETFPEEASCSIPPFPRPGRIRHTLSLIGNTLVACGGQDAPAMTTCISWQSGQSEWTDYYTLSERRFDHAAVVVEDTIIVLGGEGNNPRWSGEILKSGKQFRLKNNGRGTCAVPYDGGFVQIGGCCNHGKVDRYDVNGQHVGSLPDLNLVRFYHACTTFTSATGEQGLIVAGGSVGKSTEVYLPSTNKWTVGGALPRKLMWPGAAYLNQQIVLTGGYDGDSRTNRAEVLQYDLAAGNWSEIGKLEGERYNHAVVRANFDAVCGV